MTNDQPSKDSIERKEDKREQPPVAHVETRSRSAGAKLLFLRAIGLIGILGLATAIGAILVSQNVEGWLIGLIVGAIAELLAVIVVIMSD